MFHYANMASGHMIEHTLYVTGDLHKFSIRLKLRSHNFITLDPCFLRFLDVSSQFWDEHAAACDRIVQVAIIKQLAFLDLLPHRGPISTPELFSFAHDWGREELWGTLKQASFLLVFAKNKEHAPDWFILFRAKMKSCLVLFSAGAVYYKYARKEKLFGAIFVIKFQWN